MIQPKIITCTFQVQTIRHPAVPGGGFGGGGFGGGGFGSGGSFSSSGGGFNGGGGFSSTYVDKDGKVVTKHGTLRPEDASKFFGALLGR